MNKPVVLNTAATDAAPTTSVLDHSRLLSLVDGDTDLLRSIAGLFLKTYPALLSNIRDAIASGDGNGLARAAHTLKGSGGYFLNKAACEALTELELLAKRDGLNDAQFRFADLEREMDCIKTELSNLAAGPLPNQEEDQ
jgi:HPt (histidine-containing phosphotransfer) domain-containing protein